MKHLTIILLLVLMSCKSENDNLVDKSVYDMWNSYTKANPEFKNVELPESWFFHDNKEDANRLAQLTISGKKKAGSSLYWLYKKYDADLPIIGTKQIITDFDGKALAIIETKKVDTIPFNLITKEYAQMDMGTIVEPLKKWKKAHWDFFESVMNESREKPTEDMLVVCEIFETIWTKNSN